jgi:glutathione S-transferase
MRARMALNLANVRCEIREVSLKNKPQSMIKLSPKATVPVLCVNDRVIDESIEIINWALLKKDIFKSTLSQQQERYSNEIIRLFDEEFKPSLDRYKYNNRYINESREEHQKKCLEILKKIEINMNSSSKWFFSDHINKIDISILPFVRQFRLADEYWFDNTNELTGTKQWLDSFLKSNLYRDIMIKKENWVDGDKPIYFPYEQ